METPQQLHYALISALALAAAGCVRDAVPQTAEHDPGVPSLVVNGKRLHVVERGPAHAPTVIVLHGGPGGDHRYLQVLEPLARDFHVVWYDQRGTGLSERQDWEGLDPVEVYLDDLDALVDRFGAGAPVHLLGHSWGAMLASAYVGRFPTKVAGLVLAEPGFLTPEEARRVYERVEPSFGAKMRVAGAWFGQWKVTGPDDDARADWFMTQVMSRAMPEGYYCAAGPAPSLTAWRSGAETYRATVQRAACDEAYMQRLDFRENVDAFEGEVLFLAGACDSVIGPAHQRALMGHFARAQLVVLPGAGHFMFNDQPEASVGIVRDYFESLGRLDRSRGAGAWGG